MIRRLAALAGLAGLLLLQTACLEGFDRLITTVTYDATQQVFEVERTLVGLEPSFFQCHDLAACEAAIGRITALQPQSGMDASLADRLVARLLQSGAEEPRLRLERRGDHLDAHLSYRAPVGSTAAADTLIHAEWAGKRGKERYNLIIEAQDSYEPLKLPYTVRKQSQGAAAGGWREYWVLPHRIREVRTVMAIADSPRPIFEAVPGLEARLASAGLLGSEAGIRATPRVEPARDAGPSTTEPPDAAPSAVPPTEPAPERPADPGEAAAPEPQAPVVAGLVSRPAAEHAPSQEPTVAAPPSAPSPEPMAAPPSDASAAPSPEPDATAVSSAPGPVASPPPAAPAADPHIATRSTDAAPRSAAPWPAPDPDSPARTWVHDARLQGGIAPGVASASVQPLIPRIELCYQQSQRARPELAGYAFLTARIRGDGWVMGTSVTGEVGDLKLIRCLEEAVEPWAFPPWGEAHAEAEVEIPLTFRVEEPRGRKRRGR